MAQNDDQPNRISDTPRSSRMAATSRWMGLVCVATGTLLFAAFMAWWAQGDQRSSVGSLGAGFVAFLMIVVITPASLLAILLGHIARLRIRRSAGRLAGADVARAGLRAGYGMLLLDLVAFVLIPVFSVEPDRVNESKVIAQLHYLNEIAVSYASLNPKRG